MAHAATRTFEVPVNIYRPASPFRGKALQNINLTPDDPDNDVRHVVLDLSGGDLRYFEGQSIGIVPPGTDAQGKPHKLRLYSIASSRIGDNKDGKTVSLCVKRVVYKHPETGEIVRGVASNFICDLAPGDDVSITGPTGKTFLLPEDPSTNLVLIATGTGIAPFRAFLRRIYDEMDTPWQGKVWLFFGMQNSNSYLYQDELAGYTAKGDFEIVEAISREQKNAQGGRMYVQHRIAEHAAALWELISGGNTYTYICGLKGMEDGIDDAFTAAAAAKDTVWKDYRYNLKQSGFWHVETY
ncbi:ferredoxin--NADP(+) reductase [Gloeobacter violaceus]|uniref:Ferredoxin--NADP reductase n=1 Tax=Gloeobacter violaceus (strain ATCC 29082 / PCC 7421) TaxID=251221 RepID=Q7NI88_GLOVI|nr:ferredoxin--NADP(+) reductase [Gloeobacter violaceus]BAC90236.1 ferredoxin--NADP+ reductase [Gloeobacter violaceus PCC 7421]